MKRDYREKTVKGMIADITKPVPAFRDVTVTMTNDKVGQSLSFQCANIMIEIPLESVSDIIRLVERERT